MKRLLISIIIFSSIGIANAQWHFSITNMSYNDNCVGDDLQGLSAYLEVEIRRQVAIDNASKTYSSKEECEANRSMSTTNYSNSGCYIRITTSPCTGGNIGGGGTGGDGGAGIGGGSHGNASLYSSTAIGESYFAPNEAQIVPNMGRDLEIKLEALNKGYNNAVNGIKTGDQSFDDLFNRQVREIPKVKDSDPYKIVPRREIEPEKPIYVNDINNQEQVNLEKENVYNFDEDAIIPNINNTVSPTDIEWNEELEKKNDNDDKNEHDTPITANIFNAPSLNDQSFPNANIENVQRYFDDSEPLADIFLRNPNKLETYLEMQFESVSGFNLKEIKSKQPNDRTEEEKQALADYEAYRVKEMEQMNKDIEKYIDNSKEKKEIDAAILALDVYGDDEEGYIHQTNYKMMDLESLSTDGIHNDYGSISKVAEEIKKCNDKQAETGFHAELYYNEMTDTYVISFRGTEPKDLNDYKTDATIGINTVIGTNYEMKQYDQAMQIAEVINNISPEERDKLNIEVVGHSLGGGLASIVGLETGIETKTYNASMVPDGFLKEKGLYDKVNNGDVRNINAYHTSTDLLTNSQQAIGASAIGIPHDIGDPATLTEKTKAMGAGAVVGAFTPIGALGGAKAGEMAEGHRMAPIARHFFNSNTEKKKSEWNYIHDAQDRLKNELRSAEMKQNLNLNY